MDVGAASASLRSVPAEDGATSDDNDPPQWAREERGTEGLAELGMGVPVPQSNEDGVYRFEGEPVVAVAEIEQDGRYLRMG